MILIFKGVIIIVFVKLLSDYLNLTTVGLLLEYVIMWGPLALIIIFQPEIRLALSRVRLRRGKFVINLQDEFIDHFTACVYRMAERQIGALIVLENERLLNELLNLSAVKINADFSEELLEAIFEPSSHLHDGAVLMKGETISFARVILPLAHDTTQLSRSMGTRHRAALGASQRTDALVVVVSEETGAVSLARDGILTRGVKMDRFKAILRSILTRNERKTNPIISWMRKK